LSTVITAKKGAVVAFSFVKQIFNKFVRDFFGSRKDMKLGLYGPPNSGKTTLANKICMDWVGEELGKVSPLMHETREIQIKEQISIKSKDGKELMFNLVDTPGIATKIDYEDFLKAGMSESKAKKRAREATKGVIDAIKWLDEMDAVLVVLDATQDPYSQVNVTIIGNLQARDIPVLIVANKVDLKKANIKKVQAAFPQYDVIGISAKYGKQVKDLYERVFELVK
jgi:small GTP-binding protein